MEQLYKLVGPNGEPINGGSGDWPLPIGTEPGAWREVTGAVIPCRNALHLTTRAHVPMWAPSSLDPMPWVAYRAETAGLVLDDGTKFAAQRVRLLPRRKPAPDMAGLSQRIVSARIARQRIGRAPMPAYLRAIGSAPLPVGHPMRGEAERLRTALARADRRIDAARAAYERAVLRMIDTA